MSGELDSALDELYGSDPADFVATRKRLVADLRAAGDKAAAKDLQTARRPSTSAWALNQLARREPQLVETLLEQTAALLAAQTRAVSGQPDQLRESIRAHRDALDEATAAALAILGPRANDGFRDEIVSTLRAASDDDVGSQLRAGRLVRESSSEGFPEVAGLTLVPDPPQPRPKAKSKPTPTPTRERADSERAREREAAAQAERERDAQRQAALARRDAALQRAAEAEVDATAAQERIDALEQQLGDAREQLRAARERKRVATDEAANEARDTRANVKA